MFFISFSHINLKYYLSETDCQSWRGHKEIRKNFQLGYSWPNGMKKSFPNQVFCLCFTNCIQEDLNFVKNKETKKPSMLPSPCNIQVGIFWFVLFPPEQRSKEEDRETRPALQGFCHLDPMFHWLEIPLKRTHTQNKLSFEAEKYIVKTA